MEDAFKQYFFEELEAFFHERKITEQGYIISDFTKNSINEEINFE
ncbi:hypothetical protein ACFFLS_04780 [Flavobacterium procerum]|uniref:Uncharacterized protein n=1 Tax=Flavobacterium procerum TaxID=1455569 RepID=A0ABV6BLM1_9FLAO